MHSEQLLRLELRLLTSKLTARLAHLLTGRDKLTCSLTKMALLCQRPTGALLISLIGRKDEKGNMVYCYLLRYLCK